jgi:nucleotide-binding universal stress UspA family protein
MRITRVLVPVDFSPPSSIAVNYGVQLARRFRAKLTLLNVLEPSPAVLYAFPVESEIAERRRCERAERMLAAMLAPEDRDDLDLDIAVAMGDIVTEIATVAHRERADVVVMGTHGRSLFGRWLTGSVTQALLRKIDVPILTVCHPARPLTFERIVFATDLGASSNEGAEFAMDLANTLNAGLVVAHVIDKRPAVTYETPEVAAVFNAERNRAIDQTESSFLQIEAEARKRNVKVETVIAEGIPAEAISRIADEHSADLIVMAISKKSRMDRILVGTTAEQVIREARVPVLSVPVRSVAERREHEIDEVSHAGTQTHSARS